MSLTYGFYDSLNHDRTYSTLQFSSIFDGIISDGIYATYLDALQVRASDPTNMNINVMPGRAWFNHTWTLNDAVLTLTVEDPDVALSRIDTVILEVNSDVSGRENSIYILKGTPASDPIPAPLSHGDNNLYQYPLAYIAVANRDNVITNGGIRDIDITNKRGTEDTPFVTGLIDHITIENLTSQWMTEFEELFIELEEMISQAASQSLIDNSVTTSKIANGAVTVEKLANGAVTVEKLSSDVQEQLANSGSYDMLGIVIEGNSTPIRASVKQYVIVKNSTISGITDGMYTAAKAIPANTAIDATYLTAVSGGGLNALYNALHQDTGWISLSNYLTSSFSARSSYPPKVRIINGVYYFVGEIYLSSSITAKQTVDAMQNIPSNLRPSTQIAASGVTFSFVPYTMWLTPSGKLQLRAQVGTAQKEYEGFQMVYFSGCLK